MKSLAACKTNWRPVCPGASSLSNGSSISMAAPVIPSGFQTLLAHLGDALAAANQLERAKAIFEQLVDRQPDSDSAKRKLDNCLRKMGLPAEEAAAPVAPEEHLQAEIPKAPAPKLRPDVEPTFAPVAGDRPAAPAAPSTPAEPQLDEETQKFIAQSLTDVDLFASYGLTQKAIGLLEAILRRAPRHTPTLEKLLDFVLGAGDDRRTAELASQLEQIHIERSDLRGAERFGELRRRFQRAAGLTDAELAASAAPLQPEPPAATIPEVQMMEVSAEPEPVVEEAVLEFETPVETEPTPAETAQAVTSSNASEAHEEVDLSAEWDSMLEDSHPAEPAEKAPPARPAAPAPPPPHEVAAEPVADEEFSIAEEPVAAAPVAAATLRPTKSRNSNCQSKNPQLSNKNQIPLRTFPPNFLRSTSRKTSLHRPKRATRQRYPRSRLFPKSPPFLKRRQRLKNQYLPSRSNRNPNSNLIKISSWSSRRNRLVPAYDQKPPETPIIVPEREPEPAVSAKDSAAAPAAGGFASDQFLADLAKEIDDLGLDELTPSHSEAASPAAPPKPEEKPAAPANKPA